MVKTQLIVIEVIFFIINSCLKYVILICLAYICIAGINSYLQTSSRPYVVGGYMTVVKQQL